MPAVAPTPILSDPVEIVRNMQKIIANEMLTRGEYVEEDVSNPRLAEQGAICGGRRACAVGSLWLAALVPMEFKDPDHPTWGDMPGVLVRDRLDFLDDKPGLASAYDALNAAAREYAARYGWDTQDDGRSYLGAMEVLFETSPVQLDEIHDVMLDVTNIALDKLGAV
jgi:hypothetical protein